MAKLLIIPTPIGNLEDITLRAIRIIGELDLLLVEDTRVTSRLLERYNLAIKMQPYHQHNEHRTLQSIISKIESGQKIGLVSDAGTPAISDPGFLLVRECIRQGIDVECLPGATSFVPTLVNSGLPCEKFCFEGFLPQKKGRATRLKELAAETRTMVFFESPHRLLKTLQEFSECFGNDRVASISRELSKIHEETIRGSLAEIIAHFEPSPIKGEICIVVAGNSNRN